MTTPAAREPRPRRQALCPAHPPCPVSRKKRTAGAPRSLTLTPPSSKASPFSVKKLPARVPAASATQTGVDTSHFRERVASTRRAGAESQRTPNAEARADAGGRKRGRRRRRVKNGLIDPYPEAVRVLTEFTQESRLQSLEYDPIITPVYSGFRVNDPINVF